MSDQQTTTPHTTVNKMWYVIENMDSADRILYAGIVAVFSLGFGLSAYKYGYGWLSIAIQLPAWAYIAWVSYEGVEAIVNIAYPRLKRAFSSFS